MYNILVEKHVVVVVMEDLPPRQNTQPPEPNRIRISLAHVVNEQQVEYKPLENIYSQIKSLFGYTQFIWWTVK